VHPGDHADRHPAGIGQFDHDAADGLWQRAGRPPGRAGEPLDVGLILRGERWPHKPGLPSAADDDARRAGVRSTEVKLVSGVQHRGKAERAREGLRTDQVWFLELEPCNITNFDQRVAGAPWVLPT
jgi:hypothetical protein